MPNASDFRARARAQLGGNIFANKWLLVLVVDLIVSALFSFVAPISFGIGTLILMGPLSIGLSAVCLRQVRDNAHPVDIAETFYGFTDGRAGDHIILGVLSQIFVFLWSLLFVIPGIVKSYSYAMSYYISLDRPDLSANDCITESRRLMDGNKWRLFCLDLSFIGWYIVGSLCFGVGILWVDAYHSMARANFYEDLCTRVSTVA